MRQITVSMSFSSTTILTVHSPISKGSMPGQASQSVNSMALPARRSAVRPPKPRVAFHTGLQDADAGSVSTGGQVSLEILKKHVYIKHCSNRQIKPGHKINYHQTILVSQWGWSWVWSRDFKQEESRVHEGKKYELTVMAEDVSWQMLLVHRRILTCGHATASHQPQSALPRACATLPRTRLAAAHAPADAAPGLSPCGLAPSDTQIWFKYFINR